MLMEHHPLANNLKLQLPCVFSFSSLETEEVFVPPTTVAAVSARQEICDSVVQRYLTAIKAPNEPKRYFTVLGAN